jgi:hypothetical protein
MTDHDGPGEEEQQREMAQDLRATNDAVQSDAEKLADLEAEKATMEPADPALDRASEEAVRLGERIAHETRAERRLGSEIG